MKCTKKQLFRIQQNIADYVVKSNPKRFSRMEIETLAELLRGHILF